MPATAIGESGNQDAARPHQFRAIRPVIPAKAGIHTLAIKPAIPKSSANSSQRIPSPFMGEG